MSGIKSLQDKIREREAQKRRLGQMFQNIRMKDKTGEIGQGKLDEVDMVEDMSLSDDELLAPIPTVAKPGDMKVGSSLNMANLQNPSSVAEAKRNLPESTGSADSLASLNQLMLSQNLAIQQLEAAASSSDLQHLNSLIDVVARNQDSIFALSQKISGTVCLSHETTLEILGRLATGKTILQDDIPEKLTMMAHLIAGIQPSDDLFISGAQPVLQQVEKLLDTLIYLPVPATITKRLRGLIASLRP
ncbi:PREDICTED: uncharacterized protein LOC104785688 [Camelina sativa]|uniref:Uncharacterized protein LOC104785688 n=1 Tax=Camelina sativa TaxID=90675 RepID=A0ABM0Z1V4_CAMSA|nr:PREDICTED: uncharacterized protein LOC104785688 [Camelina sativa]